MRRNVLKLFCVVALGLVLFDGIADTSGCQDSPADVAACHVCFCGPHMVSQNSYPVALTLQPMAYFSYEFPAYSLLLQQSIFHPPRPAV